MKSRLFPFKLRKLLFLLTGVTLGFLLAAAILVIREAETTARVERELWNRKFTMKDLEALKNQEKDGMAGLKDAAAWRYGEAGTVTEAVSGRREETGTVFVCGSMALAFPSKTVSGSFEREMGPGDCVLSRELAFSLFGTADAAGLEVIYQGKVFHVAAVINKKEKLMLLWTREGDAQFAAFSFDKRDRIKEKLKALGLE